MMASRPCERTALCEPFTEMRDSAVSDSALFSSVNVSPCMNIEGQPMTSTSLKPMLFRYCSVNSPRTPMDALRLSTSVTNSLTVGSIGFRRSAL